MSPEEHRELFTDSLGEWLEENGVDFVDLRSVPFIATVDLNQLKVGLTLLIRSFGGDV